MTYMVDAIVAFAPVGVEALGSDLSPVFSAQTGVFSWPTFTYMVNSTMSLGVAWQGFSGTVGITDGGFLLSDGMPGSPQTLSTTMFLGMQSSDGSNACNMVVAFNNVLGIRSVQVYPPDDEPWNNNVRPYVDPVTNNPAFSVSCGGLVVPASRKWLPYIQVLFTSEQAVNPAPAIIFGNSPGDLYNFISVQGFIPSLNSLTPPIPFALPTFAVELYPSIGSILDVAGDFVVVGGEDSVLTPESGPVFAPVTFGAASYAAAFSLSGPEFTTKPYPPPADLSLSILSFRVPPALTSLDMLLAPSAAEGITGVTIALRPDGFAIPFAGPTPLTPLPMGITWIPLSEGKFQMAISKPYVVVLHISGLQPVLRMHVEVVPTVPAFPSLYNVQGVIADWTLSRARTQAFTHGPHGGRLVSVHLNAVVSVSTFFKPKHVRETLTGSHTLLFESGAGSVDNEPPHDLSIPVVGILKVKGGTTLRLQGAVSCDYPGADVYLARQGVGSRGRDVVRTQGLVVWAQAMPVSTKHMCFFVEGKEVVEDANPKTTSVVLDLRRHVGLWLLHVSWLPIVHVVDAMVGEGESKKNENEKITASLFQRHQTTTTHTSLRGDDFQVSSCKKSIITSFHFSHTESRGSQLDAVFMPLIPSAVLDSRQAFSVVVLSRLQAQK